MARAPGQLGAHACRPDGSIARSGDLCGNRLAVDAVIFRPARTNTCPWCAWSVDGRVAWAATILAGLPRASYEEEDADAKTATWRSPLVRVRRAAASLPVPLALVAAVAAPAAASRTAEVIVLPRASSAEGIAAGRGPTFYAGDLFRGDIFRGDIRPRHRRAVHRRPRHLGHQRRGRHQARGLVHRFAAGSALLRAGQPRRNPEAVQDA